MRLSRGLVWCTLLSLVGLGLSSYLFYLHLGLLRGELLGGPACSGTGVLNCHAVTGGAWGSFLGMPLAAWGMLGYVTVFALALLGQQSPEWSTPALTLIVLLAALFVGIDAGLLALMAFVIRFYCLFCLLTYVVNAALLLAAGLALGRTLPAAVRHLGAALSAIRPSSRRPVTGLFWGIMAMGLLGSVGVHAATSFVSQGPFGSVRKQMREFLAKQPRVSLQLEGEPKLGPPGAPLQVVEFSDFLCPACQRASKLNQIILASHRRDTVFIFKQYPLDTSCNDKVPRIVHPGACLVAAASECAHQQGKFWVFHDLVFEKGPKYSPLGIEEDLERLGLDLPRYRACMASGSGMEAVKRDIAEAATFGVGSTPTYVINGVPVSGGISPSVFEEFVAVLRETSR